MRIDIGKLNQQEVKELLASMEQLLSPLRNSAVHIERPIYTAYLVVGDSHA